MTKICDLHLKVAPCSDCPPQQTTMAGWVKPFISFLTTAEGPTMSASMYTKTEEEIVQYVADLIKMEKEKLANWFIQEEAKRREDLKNEIMPKVQKFIDKVEDGRARSKETYADMLKIKALLLSNQPMG